MGAAQRREWAQRSGGNGRSAAEGMGNGEWGMGNGRSAAEGMGNGNG